MTSARNRQMGNRMNRDFVRGAKAIFAAVVTAGMIGLVAPAVAQEVAPEQLALARKYIDLTDRGGVYEVTIVETGVETMQQIVQQNPEIIDQTNAAITKVIEEYRGSKGELLDQFARVYALRFSAEELQQIVAFYETGLMRYLGEYSLSWYLWHYPVILWFRAHVDWVRFDSLPGLLLAYVTVIVPISLLSWVSYNVVEKPAMTRKRRS